MNNEDKILEAIRLEAEGKAERIKDDFDRQIASLNSELDDRVGDMRTKNAAKCEREREVVLRRGRGSADMRRREIMLGARVELLDRAYAEAERFICNLDRDAYAGLLANMLADALRDRIAEDEALAECGESVGESAFEVSFNAKDRDELGARVIEMALERLGATDDAQKNALSEKLASIKERDTLGARVVGKALDRIGAILGAPKVTLSEKLAPVEGGFILRSGDVECDCSIKTLVGSSRASTESDTAKVLFQ